MKINTTLSLPDYINIVENISKAFFDINTREYAPHVGELFAVTTFYNYCVIVDEADNMKHPIDNIIEITDILNNNEIMNAYVEEIYNTDLTRPRLSFGNAYDKAMQIVKKNDTLTIASKILNDAISYFGDSIVTAISTIDIDKFSGIAEKITSSDISVDKIVEMFNNSDRFKEIINGTGTNNER